VLSALKVESCFPFQHSATSCDLVPAWLTFLPSRPETCGCESCQTDERHDAASSSCFSTSSVTSSTFSQNISIHPASIPTSSDPCHCSRHPSTPPQYSCWCVQGCSGQRRLQSKLSYCVGMYPIHGICIIIFTVVIVGCCLCFHPSLPFRTLSSFLHISLWNF